MKCPRCQSQNYSRNGLHQGKQKYICKACGRQWLAAPKVRGYPEAVRSLCIRMYQNGLGARSIERYTGISHSTVANWVRQTKMTARPEASSETNEGNRDYRDFITKLVGIDPHLSYMS
jgi:transposase-like protein